jgi:Flp pilus assembly protein TadD
VRSVPVGRLASLLVAAGALAVAVWLVGELRAERDVGAAQDLLAAGRPAPARARALQVTAPSAVVRAARVAGVAALQQGDAPAAAAELSRAVRRRPNDWELRRDLAFALLVAGDRRGAQAQARRTLALNPRATLPGGFRVVPGR